MKGDKREECNRTVCKSKNANYYNHSTQKYYCLLCATDIQDFENLQEEPQRIFNEFYVKK